MKKLLVMLLALLMIFSLCACGSTDTADTTVGENLQNSFEENADKSALELADAILNDSSIQFEGGTTSVTEGKLTGFSDAEITGFDEGVMFAPVSGDIPFVGYVFVLSDSTNVEGFKDTLKNNADLDFNGTNTADEVIVDSSGNKVLVIITPESFEEPELDGEGNPGEDKVQTYGEEFSDNFE